MNVEHKILVIYGATGRVTKSLKENLEAVTVRHYSRVIKKKSYPKNITRDTESADWDS